MKKTGNIFKRMGDVFWNFLNIDSSLDKSKWKLSLIFSLVAIIMVIYVGFMYKYQFKDREMISAEAVGRLRPEIVIKAMRGSIIDRSGGMLAFSKKKYNLYFQRGKDEDVYDLVNNEKKLKKELEKIVSIYPRVTIQELKDKIINSERNFTYLVEDVPLEVANAFYGLNGKYFSIHKDYERIYPNGRLGAKILGFVKPEPEKKQYHLGEFGIEKHFQDQLRGVDGKIFAKIDVAGRKLPLSQEETVKTVNGSDVKLTIDIPLQYFVEKQCEMTREELKASDVMAIVQNAKTGEILAMSDSFFYDPSDPYKIQSEQLREEYDQALTQNAKSSVLSKSWYNTVANTFYEPGSVMKIFTAACALEEGIVDENTQYNCKGFIPFPQNTKVKCVLYPNSSHGWQSFRRGFVNSCNVVFAETALKIDKDVFYEYLDKFKLFGKVHTQIEEKVSSNVLKRDKEAGLPYNIDYCKMSFGHAIKLTPLHIMNIAMAISNDGVIIEPSIVSEVDGEKVEKSKSEKVISTKTCNTVLSFMEDVANSNPEYLKVEGYRTACKTGTAVKEINGTYEDDTLVISSLLQMIPADNPRINVLVIIDQPEGVNTVKYAGTLATKISSEAARILDIEPSEQKELNLLSVPDFVGMTEIEARNSAAKNGIKIDFKYKNANKLGRITKQSVVFGSLVNSDTVVELYVE